jgi:hypothetical protein
MQTIASPTRISPSLINFSSSLAPRLEVHCPTIDLRPRWTCKGRVHLRYDLRFDLWFDLQFGACVITTTQENALPVRNRIHYKSECIIVSVANTCELFQFLSAATHYLALLQRKGCVHLRHDLRFNLQFSACFGTPRQDIALPWCVTRQHRHRIAGQITGYNAGYNASGHGP